ncbi:MAG: hypothetical protein BroJett015_38250 [Chloroflexota bacterium]|nr:MAG: hypothetical protein BroJett015_38250 [Chloroflexota bacterium]
MMTTTRKKNVGTDRELSDSKETAVGSSTIVAKIENLTVWLTGEVGKELGKAAKV